VKGFPTVEWLSENGIHPAAPYTFDDQWRDEIALWLYEVSCQWYPARRRLNLDGAEVSQTNRYGFGILRMNTRAMQLFNRIWRHYFGQCAANPIPRLIRVDIKYPSLNEAANVRGKRWTTQLRFGHSLL
jgi:hypothetical protein